MMSTLVQSIALLNLFNTNTKYFNFRPFKFAATMTGRVSFLPNNTYLKCGGRALSSSSESSLIVGFAGRGHDSSYLTLTSLASNDIHTYQVRQQTYCTLITITLKVHHDYC